MAVPGKSYAGGFAVAEESPFGTANPVPDAWLPILSETISTNRPAVKRGGIFTSRQVQCQQAGLETNAGDFTLEADANALGLPFKWLIGQVTSAALPGTIAAAPTLVPAASGNLPNGSYTYRVANVFQRTLDGKHHIGAASPVSLPAVLAGGGTENIVVNWVNETPPAGYTLAGTLVYRDVDGGGMTALDYVAAPAATYDNSAAATVGTSAVPPEQAYQHTYIPPLVTVQPDLPGFTATKLLDLTESQQIRGCKMVQMAMTVAEDGNNAVEFVFGVLGLESTKVANLGPTYAPICQMLSHQSRVSIDGLPSLVAKAMAMTVNNNLESVKVLDGTPFPKDHNEGMLDVTGNLTLGFENFEQWDRLKNGTEFSLSNEIEGTGSTEGAAYRISSNVVADAFPYAADFFMPRCLYDGAAGGNLSGAELMNENPGWAAAFSPANGYKVRARLTNRVASY